VVEVELDLVVGGGHGLIARELELLNQVLVGDLGEAATLIRVEVDVIYVEGRGDEARGGNAVADRVARGGARDVVPAEVFDLVHLEVDLNLVVLERDERESKAGVAAEPELERDVERVLRGAVGDLGERVGLTARAGIVACLTALDKHVHEFRNVANHLGVAGLLARLLGELIPDLEPVTVVTVDALATDLELNIVDEVVADIVQPAELGA